MLAILGTVSPPYGDRHSAKDFLDLMVNTQKYEVKTAILVDGGFYRKRASILFGNMQPCERADELEKYCLMHLHDKYEHRYLYRIFYYDCPPVKSNAFMPLGGKTVNLGKTPLYSWSNEFINELKHRRKFALRMGKISEEQLHYTLRYDALKRLLNGRIAIRDLEEKDFELNVEQKGVDMRIGVDISSLAFKRQVNQIVLISGDSDFVPAAKQARREGIDFILDPMGASIKDDLFEHIDGIRSNVSKMFKNKNEQRTAS